jgi:hypothetical protein
LTPNRFSKIFIIVLNIHIITDLIKFASSIAQAASQVAAATPAKRNLMHNRLFERINLTSCSPCSLLGPPRLRSSSAASVSGPPANWISVSWSF